MENEYHSLTPDLFYQQVIMCMSIWGFLKADVQELWQWNILMEFRQIILYLLWKFEQSFMEYPICV